MITEDQLKKMLKNKHVTVESVNYFVPKGTLGPNDKLDLSKLDPPTNTFRCVVPGIPVAVPRQTQRDKWMKRDCVMRYREYADRLRSFINLNDLYVGRVTMQFYLPMPDSWGVAKKKKMAGKFHTVKPDWDNLAKGVQDALLDNDSMIWSASVEKYWAELGQERTVLTFQA